MIVGVLLFGRFFAGFYTDYLWFDSVGRAGVFSTMLRTKALLFFMFGITFVALAVLNLVIADRLAPSAFSANTHPLVERFHEFFGHRLRSVRIAVAVVAGVLFAAPTVSHWQDWLMFRNQHRFGIADAQFHHDVGFYMFRLPFIAFVLDWLFAAMVFIILLVIATHVLSGGIIIQPPRPKVRRATKAHVAVLLAVLAVLKSGDYWLKRYELTNDNRGFVRGLLYSAAHAQLPAVVLLTLVALLVAGLFLSTLRTNSWRIPVVASALWAVIALIAGIIYPAAIQALVVNPNQRDKEAPYIVRNIDATKHALGIDNVKVVQNVSFSDISTQALTGDTLPLKNVRLLKPEAMIGRFRTDQSQRAGLTINDLDPDRYVIDGREQQVAIAARELDLSTIANKSWQGQHLINTHGCGLVSAPAGQIKDRRPVYKEVSLTRPELYFSDQASGYAVVDTGVAEEACPNYPDPGPYTGSGGIKLDSVFKRMAFALSYLDYNMIGSGAIDDNSRLLSIRGVEARAKKLAPFLSFDGDPYPVALDGRVLWIIDAYTTSDRYPYGESGDRGQLSAGSGLDHSFNYVRNSVKAVVDAYNGTVEFYIIDPTDPIAQVWASAFPGLFKSKAQMPAGLDAHLRYPEELFRVQTAAYSKYRLSPEAFFGRTGAWSVAQAPIGRPRAGASAATTNSVADETAAQADLATESGTERFVPYYSVLRAPGETDPSFKLLRPFVPFSTDDSKRNLQAFMTASSDPQDYGSLVAYEVTSPEDGPFTVSNTMNTEATVSQQISLLNIEGTDVVFGDLQMVPVGGGLLWIRPVYVQPSVPDPRETQPTIELVLVSQNNRAAFGSSLGTALAKLFPGFDTDIGDVVGNTPTPPADNGDGTTPPPPTTKTPKDLLDEAEQLFADADKALDDHDLATYQAKVDQARALVQQAVDALNTPTG